MTAKEKQQPRSTFIHAGRTAFQIGIPIQNNPYKDQPYRKLWDQGFRDAKKRYYDRRDPDAIPERIDRPQATTRPQQFKPKNPRPAPKRTSIRPPQNGGGSFTITRNNGRNSN